MRNIPGISHADPRPLLHPPVPISPCFSRNLDVRRTCAVPRVRHRYTIHVALTSGACAGTLPGSPFSCLVSTLTPSVAHSSSGRMGHVYVRALTSVCQCTLPCADPWESAPASLRGSQSRQFCSLHKQSSAGNSERRTLHQSSVCDCRSLRRLRQCSSGLGLGTSQIQLAVLDGVRVCRAPSQQVSGQPHGSPAAAQLGIAVGPLGRDARSEREANFLGR